MNVAFVRTPRYVWPFNSETSAFWQPLGFLSLAGQLERDFPKNSIKIIDCPGSRIGWKTLLATLRNDWPDVLCIGEETVSAHEALRLAGLAKELRPETLVIAGGVFFSCTAEQSLGTGLIDYVVHGEGEETLARLLTAIRDGADPDTVEGISYWRAGRVHRNELHPPIPDMDMLPMPAWSKVPMHRYGQGSRNHPALVSIEHGRGCIDRCRFCNLWQHMGLPSNDGRGVLPYYRTKSPERSLEEVLRLHRDYGRRTFGWVDPTWNADPQWTDHFCDLLLGADIPIWQTAWLRADCVVRDEELGILEKAVRSGLCQVMIGVERADETGLRTVNKHANGPEVTARAFEIFRRKYPDVFTIGSMLFGLWEETHDSLRDLVRYRYRLGMDYCFFIPMTPNPGTAVHEEALEQGVIEVSDFRAYNFHTPIMRTRRFSAKQLERLYFRLAFGISLGRIAYYSKYLLDKRSARRRRVARSLLRYGMQIAIRHIGSRLCHPFSRQPTVYSRKPAWYDS